MRQSPGAGIEFDVRSVARPAARPEENRLRRDKKEADLTLYRNGLRLIGATYGRVSETLDFWEILTDNLYLQPGVAITSTKGEIRVLPPDQFTRVSDLSPEWENGVLMMLMTGEMDIVELQVDWEQFTKDLVMNEAMDRVIGFIGEANASLDIEQGRYPARVRVPSAVWGF